MFFEAALWRSQALGAAEICSLLMFVNEKDSSRECMGWVADTIEGWCIGWWSCTEWADRLLKFSISPSAKTRPDLSRSRCCSSIPDLALIRPSRNLIWSVDDEDDCHSRWQIGSGGVVTRSKGNYSGYHCQARVFRHATTLPHQQHLRCAWFQLDWLLSSSLLWP